MLDFVITRLRVALLLALGCAPLPDDEYERSLVLNDRESATCGYLTGVTMNSADNAACQARVAAKRQQAVAEEMQRRQERAMREQTEAMQGALQPATSTVPATISQWCTVTVEGTTAVDVCHPNRETCNAAWAQLRGTDKPATDCTERLVPAPPPPPMSKGTCLNVIVEGGTATQSCYPTAAECAAALDFHRQSGARVTPCAETNQ